MEKSQNKVIKKKESNRKYREKNREAIRVHLKKWRENNKEYGKEYRRKNKDKIRQKEKEWIDKNRNKILGYKKKWYQKYHKEILKYHSEYYIKNKIRLLSEMKKYQKKIRPIRTVYENKYRRAREKRDPTYLLGRRLKSRARIAFTRRGKQKTVSISNLLGCSYEEARMFIEKKFEQGMSWNNYGKWHIDHIRPLNSFDLTNIEEQKKAFHYTNLQPLWAKDNLIKGHTYEIPSSKNP